MASAIFAGLVTSLKEMSANVRFLPYYADDQERKVKNADCLLDEIIKDLEEDTDDYAEMDSEAKEAIKAKLYDMSAPDLDSWAPYYSQRSEIVRKLSSSEEGKCEEWLEDIYGKGHIFDGCECFTDCEARMSTAALELAFNEVRDEVLNEIDDYFEALEAGNEVTA
jgi:hypothetical protein